MNETWEYGDAAAEPPVGPAPAPADGPDGFPWPPRRGSVVTAFGETWKGASFEPARFFAALPRESGTAPALLYYLVLGVLVAGVGLFWTMIGRLLGAGLGTTESETVASQLPTAPITPIAEFLLSPVILLTSLLLASAISHVLLLIFGGARYRFGTTVRVFCYAYSPLIFAIVPLFGALVGSVWMVVLSIIGLREAHETTGWKAAMAVLLPFILLLTVFVLGVAAFLATATAVLTG